MKNQESFIIYFHQRLQGKYYITVVYFQTSSRKMDTVFIRSARRELPG